MTTASMITIEPDNSESDNKESDNKESDNVTFESTEEICEENRERAEKTFMRFFNKALIFQANNHYDQAIEYYEKAISLKPGHLPTHQVLGHLYQTSSRFSEALHHYKHAIALHENSATLQNSAGLCEERCKNLPAAKQHYLNAAQLKQDNAEALNNLGNLCRKMGDYKIAEAHLLAALRLNISIETLANLGVMMTELGKLSLALSFYEHALRLQPDNPQLQWNKSLVLLALGDFDQGWLLYDRGKIAKTRPKQKGPKIENKADFKIDYFRNKSIFIKGEQGIGDEIMFASCIPDIIKVAKKCTIECDDRLVPLFQRSFPDALVLPTYDTLWEQQNKNLTAADVTISMASIPRFIRRDFNEFPRDEAYLFAYKKAVDQWRQRYLAKDKKLNVGISWKGGIGDETRRRSTQLKSWAPLFALDNINFINLQYGDIGHEKAFADQHLTDWPDTDHYHNIEQLAAQISALDLVISVSNATAHLAGSLGTPVYILLPQSPNWRWFTGKKPCPWYKSATLYTQHKTDEWQAVFEEIEQVLMETLIE